MKHEPPKREQGWRETMYFLHMNEAFPHLKRISLGKVVE